MPKILLRVCTALFLSVTAAVASEKNCLAEAIYFESRSEDLNGQLLVAEVVVNRSQDPRFPSSICGVISQKNQFSWFKNKPKLDRNSKEWSKAIALAEDVLSEDIELPSTRSLYFHSGRKPANWSSMRLTAVYGNHKFYRK